MNSVTGSDKFLKLTAAAIIAAMFFVGCGDKSEEGDCGGRGLPTDEYRITFDANYEGGTVTPSSGIAKPWGSCQAGGHLTFTPTPTREGYTFHGWYSAEVGGHEVRAGGYYAGNAVFQKDATIYARWELNHYRITFDAHGGEVSPAFGLTGEGWALASLPTPTRADHVFDGWYTDVVGVGEKVTVSTIYTEDATLYAHWILSGVHYTVTFDANGGAVDPPTEETDVGGKLQDLPLAERSGYAFKGWYTEKTGGTEVTTGTVFSKASTVYAQWVLITANMYIITFETHGGAVSPKSVVAGEDGKLLAPLPTPTREGHAFIGWFTEEAKVSESTVFTANTTIHAQWTIAHYTITFDATGGTVTPPTARTEANGMLTSLPRPVKSGYTFRGWYTAETGGTEVTTRTPLFGDVTIYAHWVEFDTHYLITFDPTGGEVSPTSGRTVGGWHLAQNLPSPTRDGYAFRGWFTEEAGGTPVTPTTVFESDSTIYAQWNPIVRGGSVNHGGETYNSVVIGTQTWLDRNLNYAGKAGEELGVCLNNVADNCEKYGRLYTYEEKNSVCPVGWHLPSSDEWTMLVDFVGNNSAVKLRSAYWWGGYYVGTDDYGFSALPGSMSYLQPSGELQSGGGVAEWWHSSTQAVGCGVFPYYPEGVQYPRIEDSHDDVESWCLTNDTRKSWHSVRCVKD
jgi:uncharacterized protein (TIGR02145 family)/uncharacterized repeat protein (TIGR02543 family)